VPGLPVRRLCGYIEREIDICEARTPDAELLTADGKGGERWKTAEIRVAAGPDCEVGVKRYAYCRRNLLFAITFQRRSGETVWGGFVSDGSGVKIVWFFEGGRGDSNKKSYC